MLYAPLEQFQILLLSNLKLFNINFMITNFLVINFLILTIIFFIIFFNSIFFHKVSYFYFIASSWQKMLELLTLIVVQLLTGSITKDNEKYFIIISIIFNFLFFSNIIGLIPYSFTTTSHLYITINLSFSIFIGINIITIKKYKSKTFLLFFPANTSIYLAMILVPIEFISYLAKPISLAVRLFINLMAGHTLLKVIVGFSWELIVLENYYSIYAIFPLVTLIILFGLELGVALIQTYVFIILICIYIQDGS